ncbi:Bgt-2696 [Blumeria graminis f. sp. tritici]|uniref:Bgt-2696 n=2 Tax=Blumeria graminis f. sp. tritici TaxID=62690 RepID=A0A061HF89_BLUGR|nr:hypothetical protein BGT96224_2696 [Blumeria graminis f. sp. tritici 96224]VDB90823.1 Bgt-2696 [Blumeria graminis f. sp. tritici]
MESLPIDVVPIFRAAKRCKVYRQRQTPDDDDANAIIGQNEDNQIPSGVLQGHENKEIGDEVGAETAAVEVTTQNAAILMRQRRKMRRAGGVEFKAEFSGPRPLDFEAQTDVLDEPELSVSQRNIPVKPRCFARQTGAVGDVNRHMMAYVDSELERLRAESFQAHSILSKGSVPSSRSSDHTSQLVTNKSTDVKNDRQSHRQPATIGMLQEIDLGAEVRERNVKLTERARRRLDGEIFEEEDEGDPGGKERKGTSLLGAGKSGKSWWALKRRRSDDIKRDQLVDQVLRENRLEIYDESSIESLTVDDNQAADDRIAEAFRREFLDTVSAARQRKKTVQAQPQARGTSGKKEEILRGPKLGGSRSARAAVRETLLKIAKK